MENINVNSNKPKINKYYALMVATSIIHYKFT